MMRNREWYEDSIQSIICSCLPKIPRSNIRPAYQKTKLNNPFAVNHMDTSDPMKDGVDAAQNVTNLIYFWWHFDPLDFLSTSVETSENGDSIISIIPFRLTIHCYGSDSMTNAIRLKAFFRTPDTLNAVLNLNSVMSEEPRLTTFSEEINQEWWERSDLDLAFVTQVTDFSDGGVVPNLNSNGIGEGYSKSSGGEIALLEVSNVRED